MPTLIITKKDNQEEIRKILKTLGIEAELDFAWISDEIKTEEETNFKLNYKGSSVPFWIKGDLNNFLAAISIAIQSGMNVVEISEKLKNMLN